MTEIEKRLQAMEDRIAISELRSKYCWYTVRAMREDVVGLFTHDAAFENSRGAKDQPVRVVGEAALREFFSRMQPARRIPLVMNEIITVKGDEGEGTCAMLGVGQDSFCGHYIDHFRRVEGRWLFSRRQFFPYWPEYRPDAQRPHP